MKTNYPICRDLRIVEGLPDGDIVFIPNMILTKHGEYSYALWDGADRIRVTGIPQDIKDRVDSGGTLYGIDMYIRIVEVDRYDIYSWARSNREYHYYIPQASMCTCGAVHTSFPTHHSDWCDSSVHK